MIVVSGAGRCGTSLMMHTLITLGVPTIGDPQGKPYEHCLWQGCHLPYHMSVPQKRQMKRSNPNGFFEISLKDIQSIEGYHEGMVIKMNGYLLMSTKSVDKIEKIILCRRWDLDAQAESMHRLAQVDMHVASTNKLTGSFASYYRGKTVSEFKNEMRSHDVLLNAWCKENKSNYLTVYFEDILTQPQQEINKVVDFLGIENIDTTEAVENVRTR